MKMTASEWKKTKFGQFASLHRGYDLPIAKRRQGKIPVVGSNGVVGYHDIAKFGGPGVMVGRSGSVGKSYYIDDSYWPLNTALFVEHFHGNNPRFVEFFCRHFDFSSYAAGVSVPTLNRNLVHAAEISVPPLPEQKKIAAVLLTIQRTIETQEKIIQSVHDLKKSTMQRLFTRGLGGEKTKMTEIGEIPKSWEVVRMEILGEIVTGTTPRTKRTEYYEGGGYQFIAPADLGETVRIYRSEKEISEQGLAVSRVLPQHTPCFVCIGSSIGKVGVTLAEASASNQQINAIIPYPDFDPFFVTFLLLHRSTYIAGFASPSPVPILSKGKFQEIVIPITRKKDEQKRIRECLLAIEDKIELHESKKSALLDLFKTTLNRLMTGNVRVVDLDVGVEEVDT